MNVVLRRVPSGVACCSRTARVTALGNWRGCRLNFHHEHVPRAVQAVGYRRCFQRASDGPDAGDGACKPSVGATAEEEYKGVVRRSIRELEVALEKYPAQAAGTVTGLDIATIFTLYGTFLWFGFSGSPEFVLAFALGRAFRRIRLPLDLAVAGVLLKLYPPLGTVRLIRASQMHASRLKEKMAEISPLKAAVSNEAEAKVKEEEQAAPTTLFGSIKKSLNRGVEAIDKCGLAYMIAARLGAGATYVVFTQLIKSGVDISAYCEMLGLAPTGVGSLLGSWAAAVAASAFFTPVTILLAGPVSTRVGKWMHSRKKPNEAPSS